MKYNKRSAELVETDSQYQETEDNVVNTEYRASESPEIDLGLPDEEPPEYIKQSIQKFKVNYSFLALYILSVSLNGICVAWTTGGNNQTASIFAAKLDWNAAEARKYNTMINFASQFGKTLGATFGGKLIPNGRKNIFIIFNVLAILSQILMQFLNIYTLVLGKWLNGIFVTVVHMSIVKMVNETCPVYLLGTGGSVVGSVIAVGYFLVMALGFFLP